MPTDTIEAPTEPTEAPTPPATTACVDGLNLNENFRVIGGVLDDSVSGTEECKEKCEEDEECTGFDINSDDACYFFSGTTLDDNEMSAAAGINHYAKTVCPTEEPEEEPTTPAATPPTTPGTLRNVSCQDYFVNPLF